MAKRKKKSTCKKLPAKTCKHKLYSGGSSYDKNRTSSYSSFSRSGRYRNCSTNTFHRESERKRNSRSGYRKTEISSDNRPTKRFCSKSARTSMANWIYERQRSRPRVGPIKATSTQVIGGYNKKSNVIPNRDRYADDVPYKTDGESSYSSFYSSFFKTDSGSTDDSDVRRAGSNDFYNSKSWAKKSHGDESSMSPADGGAVRYETQHVNEARRKVDPPWMQQVCVTSELVYKYQIVTKNLEETLSSDKKKMESIEQPSMVNDQLSQLYLDLQLQGVAARLTLEEGVTSSSSSGEETSSKTNNGKFSTRRRKREHSKLVMIYEEDAPLPPPSDDAASSPTF